MKVLFLVDDVGTVEMFAPVAKELLDSCDATFLNLSKWDGRPEVEQSLERLGLTYKTIKRRDKRGVTEIVQEEQPAVLILGGDTTLLEGLFISSARSKHIPTLLVQHGIGIYSTPAGRKNATSRAKYYRRILFAILSRKRGNSLFWHQLIENGWLWIKYGFWRRPIIGGHGGCTKIAVFGDTAKKLLISEGVSPVQITICGNPKFDYLYNAKNIDCKREICERWDISIEKDIILLLTDYFVEIGEWTKGQRQRFVTVVSEAVSALPKTKLIIKLHPSLLENREDYYEIVKGLAVSPIICQYVPLWKLLHACRIAITTSSTAGLEAMAIEKPLIIFNPFNNSSPFNEANGAICVYREQDLLPTINTVLYKGVGKEMKQSAEKFVYDNAYLIDGQASKRIVDLIMQMIEESKRPKAET